MRRRIVVAILGVTALAILLFGVPLLVIVDRFVENEATLRLERVAVLASRQVPGDFATSNDPVELPTASGGIALGLYDTSGRLLAGVGPASPDDVTRQALGNRVSDVERHNRRIVAVPLTANEQVIGAIRAEQSTSATDARTKRYAALAGALAIGVFAVGAVAAVIVARRLARPVRDLSRAAVALGEGDFEPEVRASGIPEIDEAAAALSSTATRLADLLRRERSFSADASHQLRTPLAGMKTAIETELEFPRVDRDVILVETLEDIERLERTIGEVLRTAREANPTRGTIDIWAVVEAASLAWHGRLARVGRPLRIDIERPLPLARGNETALRTALDVLLDNALVHGAGPVTITTAVTPTSVTITVNDHGPGFASIPTTPEGTHGHGLALAERLVMSVGGRLVIAHSGPNPRVDIVLGRVATTSGPAGRDVPLTE